MAMTPQELKDRLKGVMALVMTPFNRDESLDEVGLRECVRFLIREFRGEDGVLVPLGSSGEFYAMTDEECKRVTEIVVQEANGEIPVIVGTGRAGTKYSIDMSKHAQEIGADGVLVINPYYHLATTQGIYRHYSRIAQALDIAVILYNNPVTSKLWIDPNLVHKLSEVPNIIGSKENSSNPISYYWMSKVVNQADLVLLSGLGELMYQFEILYGCQGYVTYLASFAPRLAIEIYKAGQRRDFESLAKIMDDRLRPFYDFLSRVARSHGEIPSVMGPAYTSLDQPVYQSVTKEAMNIIGLPAGRVRDPMENLTPQEIIDLKSVLREMEVVN